MNTHAHTSQPQDVIEILDPVMRKGFAQIPRLVLRARGLSRNAKCLYALLLDYAWQEGSCFPGQQRLADDLGVSDRTIRDDLNELRAYGLIDWQRRGLSLSNVYAILPLATCEKLHLHEPSFEADRKNSSELDRKSASALDRKHTSDNKDPVDKYSTQQHRVVVEKQGTKPAPTASSETAGDPVAALVGQGLSKTTVEEFVGRYPSDYLKRHLEMHAVRLAKTPRISNPPGVLRRAIEEDWAPPPGYVSAEKRLEREQQRAEQAARFTAMLKRHELESPQDHRADDRSQPAIQSSPIRGCDLTTTAAWDQVVLRLKRHLSTATFTTLIKNTQLVRIDDGVASIAAPSSFIAELLQRRHEEAVRAALEVVVNQRLSVQFITFGEAQPDLQAMSNLESASSKSAQRADSTSAPPTSRQSNTRAVRVHSAAVPST